MKVLFVNQEEVPRYLPMADCMDAMTRVLSTLARGEAILPLRSILWLPERVGGLGLMPAALLPDRVVGLKAITFFP
jgi:ornithine cyclodeaminase/alanine dehydrogenase-like protein (mu-crystallin family)